MARVNRKGMVPFLPPRLADASVTVDTISPLDRLLAEAEHQMMQVSAIPHAQLPSSNLSMLASLWATYIAETLHPYVVEDAGVRVGSFTGYRLWVVKGHTLWSIGSGNRPWLPGVVMEGDPDHNSNAQGVYAFSRPEDAINLLVDYTAHPYVFGTVKMWGRYVEHRLGYRAEFARITGLLLPTPTLGYENLATLRTLYLDNACPPSMSRVVNRHGRLVGCTTALMRNCPNPFAMGEPVPVTNAFGMPVLGVAGPYTARITYFHWNGAGEVQLTDDEQDPSWLPGWVPLPTR